MVSDMKELEWSLIVGTGGGLSVNIVVWMVPGVTFCLNQVLSISCPIDAKSPKLTATVG